MSTTDVPEAPIEKDELAGAHPPKEETFASRLALVAVASALFMQGIDTTALSTALPTMAHAFNTDPIHLKLALTSYMVSLAVFVPASGWAADRFGARRVFIIAIGIFLLGSMLSGLSRDLGTLIGFRILQGFGGAMMTPVGRMIIIRSTPRHRLVHAMMWFGMPAMMGPMVGPGIAGVILSIADWPWIFYINLPVGLLGIAAVMAYVPYQKPNHKGGFDVVGFVLVSLTIAATMTVAETIGMPLISSEAQIAAGVLAIVCAATYVFHAKRKEHPVLDLKLFKYQTLRASMIGGLLIRINAGATPLLLPLLLQIGLKWSPLQAGLVTMATAMGAVAARPFSPVIIPKIGFRNYLIVSAVLVALLGMVPAWFRDTTPVSVIFIVLAFTGLVRTAQISTLNTLTFDEVPHSGVSGASTILAVSQQVSLSLGVTAGGLLLYYAENAGGTLTPSSFIVPFMGVSLIALLSLFVHVRLPASAGASMGGRA